MVFFKHKQKGVTLVVAVLLMAAVMATSLLVASIIVKELGMTRNLGDSVMAYYAGETGVESYLYDLKRGSIPQMSGSLANGANWSVREVSGEGNVYTFPDVPRDKSIEVPLYNIRDGGSKNIDEIRISWSAAGFASAPEIEWSFLSWDQNMGNLELEPGPRGVRVRRGKNQASPIIFQAGVQGSPIKDESRSYILRFKHINGDNKNLSITVTALKDGGAVPLDVQKQVRSTGTVSDNISRAVEVKMMPKRTAYDVFDYVIFSDSELEK
ncbi:MAG: hypothetical protein ACD_63C00118G0003 [uncultured bacterium]|nr:MAG: hypothetical protein ACD_63C00118G0003 [uncultured bacterium]